MKNYFLIFVILSLANLKMINFHPNLMVLLMMNLYFDKMPKKRLYLILCFLRIKLEGFTLEHIADIAIKGELINMVK